MANKYPIKFNGSSGFSPESWVTNNVKFYNNNVEVDYPSIATTHWEIFTETTTIGEEAFIYCEELISISHDEVTNLSDYALSSCPITSVNLPNVTSIGGIAIAATKLTTLSLPELITIGDSGLGYNSNLTTLSLPKLTTVGNGFLTNCIAITEVSLPNLTSMDKLGFLSCINLTNIDLPKITNIGVNAFQNCEVLVKLNLGLNETSPINSSTITSLGDFKASTGNLNTEQVDLKIGFIQDSNVTIEDNILTIGNESYTFKSITQPVISNISELIIDDKVFYPVGHADGIYTNKKHTDGRNYTVTEELAESGGIPRGEFDALVDKVDDINTRVTDNEANIINLDDEVNSIKTQIGDISTILNNLNNG